MLYESIWGIAILEFRFNLRFSRRRFQHRIVFAFFVDPGAADINIVKESARSCAGLRRGVTPRKRATVSVWTARRRAEDTIARARGAKLVSVSRTRLCTQKLQIHVVAQSDDETCLRASVQPPRCEQRGGRVRILTA